MASVTGLLEDTRGGSREMQQGPSAVGHSANSNPRQPTSTAPITRLSEEQRVSINKHGVSPFSSFKLNRAMIETLSVVGAADQCYNFFEIKQLLVKYILENRHLIDPKDSHYVNCEEDKLGPALGVERFHSSELQTVLARNVILIQPFFGELHQLNDNSKTHPHESFIDPCKVGFGTYKSPEKSLHPVLEKPPPKLPVCQAYFTFPAVPEYDASEESSYSYQGYVTEEVRNTEYETDEDDTREIEIIDPTTDSSEHEQEEYEPVTDNDNDNVVSEADSNSEIEDISIAVVASLCNQGDEDSFADIDEKSESDMETQLVVIDKHLSDSSSEEDPELKDDRWRCLLCGKHNKPYMRYCLKCWQLRKNWLPDRPKKRRRRRTRSKKRNKESKDVAPKDDNTALPTETTASTTTSEVTLVNAGSDLTKSLSTASTMSLNNQSLASDVNFFPLSQDSGISLSQELQSDGQSSVIDTSLPNKDVEITVPSSSNKRPHTDEVDCNIAKKIKPDDYSSADDEEAIKLFENLKTKKKWLHSSRKGKETFKKLIDFYNNLNSNSEEDDSVSSKSSSLCSICCVRPKNASIIHGRVSHQCTCYPCARKLYDSKFRCPVCCRKIHMITKHFVV